MDLLDARNFFLLFWIFTDKLFVRFASNTSSGGKSSIEKNTYNQTNGKNRMCSNSFIFPNRYYGMEFKYSSISNGIVGG